MAETRKPKMAPCPFCGGSAHVLFLPNAQAWAVSCRRRTYCGATGPAKPTRLIAENECLDASVMEYRHRNEELLAEVASLRAQLDGVKLPAELHAAATVDFEQTGFAALTDYGRGLALRVLALGPQIVGPAVPPEERKPYSAPTLTCHGTDSDLAKHFRDAGSGA